jgi:hypothetical protein
MPAINVIKLRRGTAAQWTTADSVLAAGEMGVELDTGRSKFGDGTTAWTSLSYSVGDSSGIGTVEWTSVANKPTEFPSEAHTHVKAEITDFAHTHVKAEITDFAHAHVKAEITDFAHVHLLSEITDYTIPTVLSDTAPSSPTVGLKWVKTTTMQQYIYFDSNWVEI